MRVSSNTQKLLDTIHAIRVNPSLIDKYNVQLRQQLDTMMATGDHDSIDEFMTVVVIYGCDGLPDMERSSVAIIAQRTYGNRFAYPARGGFLIEFLDKVDMEDPVNFRMFRGIV